MTPLRQLGARILFTLVATATLTASALAQDPTGTWTGKLNIPGASLDLTFHIESGDSGFSGSMDILQQGLADYPLTSVFFQDSLLHITLADFGIEYKGRFAAADSISGDFRQSGFHTKLSLVRGEIILSRPQEPKPPFPYRSTEVEFENPDAGITLSGTLTTPREDQPCPLVIIISGSGPQDRDGLVFGHKPYLVLGDHLTRNGIAVFRFDERGVGKSGGTFETATVEDHISDVDAALRHLGETYPKKFSSIGLIGHSLGGIVASEMAAERDDIDMLILLASPGVDGITLMLQQKEDIERGMGVGDLQIAIGQNQFRGAYELIASHSGDTESLRDSLQNYFLSVWGPAVPEQQRTQVVDQVMIPELIDILRSEPALYLQKVSCPVLAITGSKDVQVASEPNLSAIRDALESGGNQNTTIIELPDLNHIFQESETGMPSEYAEIPQTMSPKALEAISAWIKELDN